MHLCEETVPAFRRNLRRKLYDIASAKEFHLYDDVPENNWMRQRVDSTFEGFKRTVIRMDSNIVLLLGPPGSGKTYCCKVLLKRLRESQLKSGSEQIKVEVILVEVHNSKDEMRCIRHLLIAVEQLAEVNLPRPSNISFQDVQERMSRAMKLLRESNMYLYIVLEGADILTKGKNDCSITTGSCSRRQGLLYILSSMISSRDFAFTLICITADIRTLERLEKRVKSRFAHETVYCHNGDNIAEVFGSGGISLLGPKCKVTLDSEAKVGERNLVAEQLPQTSLSEDLICGFNVTTLIASSCLALPEGAIQETSDGGVEISKEAMSSSLMYHKEKGAKLKMFEQLSLPEHYILVALARLHTKRIPRITLIDVEEDLAAMGNHLPREKHTIPRFPGLLRAFHGLIYKGVIEWVNFEHNWIKSAPGRKNIGDLQGSNASCRFPYYEMYLKLDHSKVLPTHLALWLSLAVRAVK